MISATLTTARLQLRPFSFSDVPEFHSYINDPEMGVYLEGEVRMLSQTDASAIIARHMLVDEAERRVWAITSQSSLVGAITINFEKEQRISEIGYSIKKSFWGQGFASEAAQAVVYAAFEAYPHLQRIQAGIHPDNQGSIRVATSAHMEYEGTLKSFAFVKGQVADEAIYAITRDTWEATLSPGIR